MWIHQENRSNISLQFCFQFYLQFPSEAVMFGIVCATFTDEFSSSLSLLRQKFLLAPCTAVQCSPSTSSTKRVCLSRFLLYCTNLCNPSPPSIRDTVSSFLTLYGKESRILSITEEPGWSQHLSMRRSPSSPFIFICFFLIFPFSPQPPPFCADVPWPPQPGWLSSHPRPPLTLHPQYFAELGS